MSSKYTFHHTEHTRVKLCAKTRNTGPPQVRAVVFIMVYLVEKFGYVLYARLLLWCWYVFRLIINTERWKYIRVVTLQNNVDELHPCRRRRTLIIPTYSVYHTRLLKLRLYTWIISHAYKLYTCVVPYKVKNRNRAYICKALHISV